MKWPKKPPAPEPEPEPEPERRQKKRKKHKEMLNLERKLKAEAKERRKIAHEAVRQRQQRRAENELNSASTQRISGAKLKTMSKKQLRGIKRVSVRPDGSKEFTNPWGQ